MPGVGLPVYSRNARRTGGLQMALLSVKKKWMLRSFSSSRIWSLELRKLTTHSLNGGMKNLVFLSSLRESGIRSCPGLRRRTGGLPMVLLSDRKTLPSLPSSRISGKGFKGHLMILRTGGMNLVFLSSLKESGMLYQVCLLLRIELLPTVLSLGRKMLPSFPSSRISGKGFKGLMII